jgi:hypothetical protein
LNIKERERGEGTRMTTRRKNRMDGKEIREKGVKEIMT